MLKPTLHPHQQVNMLMTPPNLHTDNSPIPSTIVTNKSSKIPANPYEDVGEEGGREVGIFTGLETKLLKEFLKDLILQIEGGVVFFLGWIMNRMK